MKNKRLYYEVVANGGAKTLLKTYSLSKAKKYRIEHAKEMKIPRYGVGIDKFVWDKDINMWERQEIC